MAHTRVPELLADNCAGCCFNGGGKLCTTQCVAEEVGITAAAHIMIEDTPEAMEEYLVLRARIRFGLTEGEDDDD